MRRRRGLGGLLALTLVATAVACGGDDGDGVSADAEPGVHGVGVVSTAIDAGPTIAEPVPTEVFYPAQTTAGEPARSGAAAAAAQGPYPLVVFVHGAGNGADTYRGLIEILVSQGYVVAAPTFPESSSPSVVGSNRALDLAEPQALALPAIVERVRSAGIGGIPTASLIDPDQLHLIGHSLGAATVLSAAFNTCCRMDGVTSVTGLSSVLLETSGEYELEGAPVLFLHGAEDDVIPVSQAELAYEEASSPKFLVVLPGQGHYEYVLPNSPAFGIVVLAVSAMLEGASGGTPVDEGLAVVEQQVDGLTVRADP